ncbi:MAG: hypothetical protein AAF560_01605 [Acidobacteriota bacterium]
MHRQLHPSHRWIELGRTGRLERIAAAGLERMKLQSSNRTHEQDRLFFRRQA